MKWNPSIYCILSHKFSGVADLAINIYICLMNVKVQKSRKEKLLELNDALKQLDHSCIQFVKSKERYHLSSTWNTLRALVCSNPKRPNGNLQPLLLNLADEFNIELPIHSAPPRPEKPRDGLISHMATTRSWSPLPKPYFQLYSVRNWMLSRHFYVPSENKYASRNDTIRGLADNSSSHYDNNYANSTTALKAFSGSELDGIAFFTLDTVCAILYAGQRFLRRCEIKIQGISHEADSALSQIDAAYDRISISMGDTVTITGKSPKL